MSDDEKQLVPDPDHGTEPPEEETPTGSGEQADDKNHDPSPAPGRALGGGVARSG
jgi:hypothetical protein